MSLSWKVQGQTLGEVTSKNISAHKIYFVDKINATLNQDVESTFEVSMGGQVIRTFKLDLGEIRQKVEQEERE